MVNISDFREYLRLEFPLCDGQFFDRAVINVINKICEQTFIWRYKTAFQLIQEGVNEYVLTIPDMTKLVTLLRINYVDRSAVTPDYIETNIVDWYSISQQGWQENVIHWKEINGVSFTNTASVFWHDFINLVQTWQLVFQNSIDCVWNDIIERVADWSRVMGGKNLDYISEIGLDGKYPKEEWRYRYNQYATSYRTNENRISVLFFPIPRDVLRDIGFELIICLKLDLRATTVPEFFYKDYLDTIVNGVREYLFSMRSQPWGDLEQVGYYKRLFLDGIGGIKRHVITGFERKSGVVEGRAY